MPDYKITLEATVRTGNDLEGADALGEYLCNIVDTVLAGIPDDTAYLGIRYGVTVAGKEAAFGAPVSEYGHSLAVNITKHANLIGVKKGDIVAVTVRKIKEGKE